MLNGHSAVQLWPGTLATLLGSCHFLGKSSVPRVTLLHAPTVSGVVWYSVGSVSVYGVCSQPYYIFNSN